MSKLTLPIQPGKKYVRRDGEVVTAVQAGPGRAWVSRGGIVIDLLNGRIDDEKEHPLDLVADHVEPVKGHVHAANMALFAHDAAETDKPWERWEMRGTDSTLVPAVKTWLICTHNPDWHPRVEYRRKPKTIRIGEFDVPEPLREQPEHNAFIYIVDPAFPMLAATANWISSERDLVRLKRGLLHATREAAELHAKALVTLTEVSA